MFELGQNVVCKETEMAGKITQKEWEMDLDGWLYEILISSGTCIYREENEITIFNSK